MKLNGNIEIKIGSHIGNSHVFVNGKELHVTHLNIALDASDRIPKVAMTVPLLDGELVASVNEADITFKELSELIEDDSKK